MSCMFSYCNNLANINLSNVTTQNVTYMRYMFSGCYNLKKNNVITNDYKILNQFEE